MERPSDIPKKIKFYLCDYNSDLVEEWKFYFDGINNFEFYNGDIFTIKLDQNDIKAIVSPANSFGDLQGGIDLLYYQKFGHQLEEDLQKIILNEKFGELVVGDAIIMPLDKSNSFEYFISAPTMRVPMNIERTINVYLAFRAILIELIKFNTNHCENPINIVVCPGLGTGIGQVSPQICAKQMWCAYNSIINPDYNLDLKKSSWDHCDMIGTIIF